MVKQNFLTKMLLLCALIVGSSSAWADDTYQLITSTSDLEIDAKYIIVYETGQKAMGTIANDRGQGISVTISNHQISLSSTSNVNVLTLGGSSTGYTLLGSKDNNYIGYNSGTKLASAGSASTNSYKWTITFSGNDASIANVATDSRLIRCYNNQDFRAYTTSNGDAVQLYKKVDASAPSATLSTTSLAFGEVAVGTPKSLTFTVTPANLKSDLSIASNNENYTVSPTSIAQATTTEQTITVTANPTAWNADMNETITISGGGLASNKSVTLTASPYQVANVTLSGTGGTFEKDDAPITSLTSRVGSKATIKAVPNEHYTFTSWAAEGATPASSTDAETEFTFTAASVTLTATFTIIPTHTATFYVLGAESEIEVYEGDAITFPSVTAPTGYTFMGWTETEITGTQAAAPADLTNSATMGTSDVTYCAVFAKGTETPVAFNRYEKVTSAQTDWSGTYILASTYTGGSDDDKKGTWVYKEPASSGKYGVVEAIGELTTEKTNNEIVISKTTNGYTIYHSNSEKYFAYDGSDNQLNFADDVTDEKQEWTISMASGTLVIKNVQYTTRSLKYNGSSPRFACYTSGQTAPDLYKRIEEGGMTYSDYCTTIPPVVTVNIPASHYGTYCSEYALDFSGTVVEAYTAAYVESEGKVVLTKIADGIVPANTGVVLYSETKGEQDIPTTTTTNTIDVDNEMVGVTVQTPVAYHPDSKYNYILQEGKFKKATGASLRANRAYLSTTYNVSPSGAPELDLAFGDETTGIQNVERTVNDNQYYTLDGRRVAQPTKGLYIVNGKKVVIK